MLEDADREWIRNVIREEIAAALSAKPPTQPESNQSPSIPDAEVNTVFEHWKQCWGKTQRTKLDNVRKRAIIRALKSYNVETLMRCLSGYRFSDFHTGRETGQVFDEITLHLRDAPHIEAGLRFYEQGSKPQQSQLIERALSVARGLDLASTHP